MTCVWRVLIPVDDFSNQIITGGRVDIFLDGKRANVIKKSGYHVFTDTINEGILKVSGGGYQRKEITLDHRSDSNKPHYIRLLPDQNDRNCLNAAVFTGNFRPNQQVCFRFHHPYHPYRILDAGQGKTQIHIYHDMDTFLEGMCFQIKEGEKKESFLIEDRMETNGEKTHQFCLDKPLLHSYDPMNCVVKREYYVDCDKEGNYFFLIPDRYTDMDNFELETGESVTVIDRRRHD